jgi:hypothetical protein
MDLLFLVGRIVSRETARAKLIDGIDFGSNVSRETNRSIISASIKRNAIVIDAIDDQSSVSISCA